MIPDVEATVIAYLKADAPLEALVGERIGTRNPASLADPWVKMTQLGDAPVAGSSADHLIEVFLQFDCYGGDDIATAQGEAKALYRRLRATLKAMPDSDHADAVISDVRFAGDTGARIPDASVGEPARERYVLSCFVVAHDEPGGS